MQTITYILIALICLGNVSVAMISIIGAALSLKVYTEMVKERAQQIRANFAMATSAVDKAASEPARDKIS